MKKDLRHRHKLPQAFFAFSQSAVYRAALPPYTKHNRKQRRVRQAAFGRFRPKAFFSARLKAEAPPFIYFMQLYALKPAEKDDDKSSCPLSRKTLPVLFLQNVKYAIFEMN